MILVIIGILWIGTPMAQSWTPGNAVPTTASLYGSMYANNTFFAIGNAGALITSSSGAVWTAQATPTNQRLRSIAADANYTVAICQSDSVISYTSGAGWVRSLVGSKISLQSICHGISNFVIAGDSGRVFVAANPRGAWTKRETGSKARLNCIIWTGSRFIAAGDSGTIVTSPDGTTWAKQASGVKRRINAMVSNGTGAIAVGDSGVFLSSDNGQSWSMHSGITYKNLLGVASDGSRFVAVGPSDSIYYSDNGAVWQSHELSSSPYAYSPSFLYSICSSGAQFVATGRDGIVLTSSDGIHFSEKSDITLTLLDISVQYGTWLTVGVRLKGSTPMGSIILSGNGSSWTESDPDVSPQILRCIARNTSQTIVMGESDTIITSSNLFNWNKISMGSYRDFTDVVWNGSFFTAINSLGKVLTSVNGTVWAEKADLRCMLQGLCWNGNQFLAVGDTGAIFTSANAVQWTPRQSNTTSVLYSAAWNGVRYVIVGENATTLTSTNGIAWSEQQLSSISAFTRLFSVSYNGAQFMVCGENGTLLSSYNGLNWNIINCGTTANLYSIACKDAQNMVTVGIAGTIRSYSYSAVPVMRHGTTVSATNVESFSIVGNNVHLSVTQAGPVRLVIYDMRGRQITTIFDAPVSKGMLNIPLTRLARGSYCMQLATRSGTVNKVFIISK